jgi:predicted MFS family arabinose efflux permease
VAAAAAFLFLWTFNPFSTSVLYVHMTRELGMSEQFYGVTVSLLSVGAILGSLAYGTYCRRVPLRWLIHTAIAAGALSTLAYCGMTGKASAAAGSMVQFDLAARACPLAAAGTTFALLMALSNLSYSISTGIGGLLYDRWTESWGAPTSFNLLVAAGSLSTCACWLLVPLLNRQDYETG